MFMLFQSVTTTVVSGPKKKQYKQTKLPNT